MPIRSVDPKTAHDEMAGGGERHAFLDVRTVAEYEAGHPAGAVNVPWAVVDPATGQMAHNERFLPAVRELFDADTTLYVSCQAGGRSLRACQELQGAGYTSLVNVDGGFGGRRDPGGRIVVQGWAASKLPVESTRSSYGASQG